jgi:hypothetical protein
VPLSLRRVAMEGFLGVETHEAQGFIESHLNGLSLVAGIEAAFNRGEIVFLPIRLEPVCEWRCLVVNPGHLNRTILGTWGTIKLREIDGKALQFRTSERPSRRALFFGYFLAFARPGNKAFRDRLQPPAHIPRRWFTPQIKQCALREFTFFFERDFAAAVDAFNEVEKLNFDQEGELTPKEQLAIAAGGMSVKDAIEPSSHDEEDGEDSDDEEDEGESDEGE